LIEFQSFDKDASLIKIPIVQEFYGYLSRKVSNELFDNPES